MGAVGKVAGDPCTSMTPRGGCMSKEKKLLEAWDQLVRTLARKDGLNREQAALHIKKHFPELYKLYEKAKREKVEASR